MLWYVFLGRRLQRDVYTYDGSSWGSADTTKFLYNGRLMLVELDGSDDVVRTYTWGLDLAGLHTANSGPGRSGYPTSGGFLQAAGGIGGLLAVYDADASDGYVYFHDANGNVGQVVAWENGYGGANGDDWHADRLVAKYEYSPFGAVVGPDDDADGDWRDDAGAFATDNPFRFSTKWHDDAVGVSDFGARMYSATLGRFLNRDPIAEAGGVNLYAFAGNDPVNRVDPFGYHNIPGCGFGVTCPEYDARAELLGGDSGIDVGPGGLGGDGMFQTIWPPLPRDIIDPPGTNWGTCADCDQVCGRGSKTAFGVTTCEGGKACFCVCGTTIRGGAKGLDGLDRANGVIEGCVMLHELIHVGRTKCKGDVMLPDPPGTNEECAAERASAKCIENRIGLCDSSLNKKERCRCLNRLLFYLNRYVSCDGTPPRGTRCPATDVTNCKNAKREARATLYNLRTDLGC